MMKLILLTALAAVALAEPWYGYYPHQLQWPGVRAPGFSSTCWGCRGKRSAPEEPELAYGQHPTGKSYVANQVWGARGKRSAEPEPFYGYYGHPYLYRPYLLAPGVAGHPGGATSYTQRSPQGLRGKRSAEPEPYYGYYGFPGYGYHGYGGRSYVGRTIWGLGK